MTLLTVIDFVSVKHFGVLSSKSILVVFCQMFQKFCVSLYMLLFCLYDMLGSFVFVFNFYLQVLLWSFVRFAHVLHAVLAVCTVLFWSKIYDDDDDDMPDKRY